MKSVESICNEGKMKDRIYGKWDLGEDVGCRKNGANGANQFRISRLLET